MSRLLENPFARIVLGYLLLVEVGIQLVFGRITTPWFEVGLEPHRLPLGVLLIGGVIGILYGLIAIGLILVYRANRIVNFAQAQLGAVPAVAGLLLIAAKGWNYLVVLPLVLLGGGLLGAGVELAFVRRFQRSSRLVLTVVTIGIGFLLLVLEFLTKQALVGGELLQYVTGFPTPFDNLRFNVGTQSFVGDHIAAIVFGAVAIVGTTVFLRATRVGMAVRAAAENLDLASLLGIPVGRMWTIVWAIAGVLSAVGVFLRGTLVALPLGGFVGPLLLLYGLAAAVMARMEKLSTAMLAGVAIGIADYASVYATNSSEFSSATMLVLILGALLLQRRRLSRAFDTGVASWESATDQRPVPTELRDLPLVRHGRRGLAAVGLLTALAVPWIVGSSSVGFATIAVVYAMVGVSLVILTGWAGQISLGQFAFAGIGAAVTGKLVADHGFDLFLALAVAGLVGAAVALLIGLPALRIQGLFLAVVTLAFAFTVGNLVLDRDYFGWLLPGGRGFVERPVLWSRIDLTTNSEMLGVTFTGDTKLYLLALAFLLLSMGMARSLRRYRSGRVFVATRDNERVAQAFGISPASTRLAAFAISGFIAALAGGIFAIHLGSVTPGAFRPELSIQLFVMTVIGGITSVGGAILGAVFLQGLPMLGLRDLPVIGPVVEILGTGLGILLILSFLPGGLAQGVGQLRDNWLRWVADRRGIVVPSLLADVRTVDGDDEDLEELIRHASSDDRGDGGGDALVGASSPGGDA